MRILKLSLTFISLALMSAALSSAASQRAFPGDPVEDEFVGEACPYDDVMPDGDAPIEDELAPVKGSEEDFDFFLQTGERPKEELREEQEKPAPQEDAEPKKDEWFDEHVVCGDDDDGA